MGGFIGGGGGVSADQILLAGENYIDVTASRALGVNFVNTKNRPKSVVVCLSGNSPTAWVNPAVNGVTVGLTQLPITTGQIMRVQFEVPPGATYIANSGAAALYYWSEL